MSRLNQYLIEGSTAIKFIRFGNLSKTKFKMDIEAQFSYFHFPPKKKGIFAFIWPYIDDLLWAWQFPNLNSKEFKEKKKELRKEFMYSGDIWCHFIEDAQKMGLGKEYKGPWVKVHTDDLKILLKKVKHQDIKQSMKYSTNKKPVPINDPYKKNPNVRMSIDHLEVFIEKVN